MAPVDTRPQFLSKKLWAMIHKTSTHINELLSPLFNETSKFISFFFQKSGVILAVYLTIVDRGFLMLLFYEDPLYCLPPFSNWNLPLNFRYFHFSARTILWVAELELWVDISRPQLCRRFIEKKFKNNVNFGLSNFQMNLIQNSFIRLNI